MQPQGSTFHSGFLGEDQFKFDLKKWTFEQKSGVVYKKNPQKLDLSNYMGLYSRVRLHSSRYGIQKAIHRANTKAIANPHKVQTFKNLPLVGGELGRTMKSKRHFIVNKYSDYIAKM